MELQIASDVIKHLHWESVVGSVIQPNVIVALGWESSLEAAGALRAAAPSLGSIPNPSGGAGWSWGQCGCHRDPPVRPNSRSAEFCTSVVLDHSCCVVRIELAIGSLPNPRQSGAPTVW